jgi:hypothetical protein
MRFRAQLRRIKRAALGMLGGVDLSGPSPLLAI